MREIGENAMDFKPIVECTRDEALEQLDRFAEHLAKRRADIREIARQLGTGEYMDPTPTKEK